jgi:spore maturation protein CgeB
MLTEDTEEHREILGPDGQCVLYFRQIDEMIARARWLLENKAERARLSAACQARIRIDSNTYKHRLTQILAAVEARSANGRRFRARE